MINELLNDSASRKIQKINEKLNLNQINLNLPNDISVLKKMRSKVINIKERMVLSQKFNSYHKNLRYQNLNLILEAINLKIKIVNRDKR